MSDTQSPPLRITSAVIEQIGQHMIAGYPHEACGLLVGTGALGEVLEFHPTDNDAKSARVYTVNPKQHLRIERDAEDRGFEVIGVVHSHTHTEAYPSPTDVAQAPDSTWFYVIVTLKRGTPEPRSFRITNGAIDETEIAIL
jgi:proteasome lid subunit RPN8/RPN11